jgi:hypothetical protein
MLLSAVTQKTIQLLAFASSLLIVLAGLGGFVMAVAQQPSTILIPVDFISFTPSEEAVQTPGEQDITIAIENYDSLSSGALCNFTVTQPTAGDPLELSFNSTYNGSSCAMTLPVNQQVAGAFDLEILITNPNGQRFGSELVYFITSDDDFFDPDYEVPLKSLYVKPEVNIIIPEKEIQTGSLTTAQVEIRNLDNFALRDFEVSVSISNEIARVVCESLDFTEQRIEGETVFTPIQFFGGVKAEAQTAGRTTCSDGFSFDVDINEVGVGRTTRLNFILETETEGSLQFDIATNLDQGGVSRRTDPINIIRPETAPVDYSWIFWMVGSVVIGVGGWYGYRRYRRWREENV